MLKNCNNRIVDVNKILRTFRSAVIGVLAVQSAAGFASLNSSASESGPKLFYISPQGDDKNPGTIEAPVATFDKILELIRQNPGKDINIYLRGGNYVLNKTFTVRLSDWNSSDKQLVFESYPGEIPVISSDRAVTKWEKAGGNIWMADIPAGVTNAKTLYRNGKMLQRARSKGFYPAKNVTDPKSKYILQLPEPLVQRSEMLSDAELLIIPTWPWVMNILPIKSIDEEKNILTTKIPGTYPLAKLNFGRFPDGSFWIENMLEFLDEPGEWVMDTKQRKIYYWPLDSEPENITVPALTEYIRLEGDIDYDAAEDKPIKNISFKGITFARGDRFGWDTSKTGRGLQHDWEMFDRPTAMVRLRGAENCVIDNCRFVNSGGAALRLDLHCQKNEIKNSSIEDIGGAGILLVGYGPGTKNVNRNNKIINNHIHDIGQLLWHSAGIFAWQSGENTIQNNLIHHTPYAGIIVSGRIAWDRSGMDECSKTIRWNEIDPIIGKTEKKPDWYTREPFLHGRDNLVEKNEIHDAMQMLGDGNCIYISGTGKGNKIRNNYLHNNVSPSINANIRCDDDQNLTIIENNIIANSCGEGFIIKGKNTIRNNIIYNLMAETPNGIASWHQRGYLVLSAGNITGSVVQNNVFVSKIPGQNILYESCKDGLCSNFQGSDVNNNVFFNPNDPHWATAYLDKQRRIGNEKNGIFADPLFMDADSGNFTLKPGSPALERGFENINMEEIGLLK